MRSPDKPIFPHSWFRVATSQALSASRVISLHYFSKDLVLFRTQQGNPCILDAHCPHLGAHLGHGGTVIGDTLRCPYHGWLWDSRGYCVDIPYRDKCPQVKIPSYPAMEVNGLIFMYYHEYGSLPTWHIPSIPELDSHEWTKLQFVHQWKARTNLQNYLDNSVDVSHLFQLHQQTFTAAISDFIESEDHILTHKMSQKYNLSGLISGGLISENGWVTTTYYGLGYDVSFYQTKGKFNLNLLQIFTATPIDDNYLDIQIFLSVKKVFIPPLNQVLALLFKKDTIKTFEQDISILENRSDRINYLFLKEDNPIRQSRDWAKQFY